VVNEVDGGDRAMDELFRAAKDNDPYGLMLLDIDLPGMDEFQMLQRLNALLAPTRIPVIMLTSREETGDRGPDKAPALSPRLSKPVKRAELIEGVMTALGSKKKVGGETRFTEKRDEKVSRPLQILLAEDIAANRKVIKLFLKTEFIDLDMAEDGKTAVEKFKRRKYDVVLMDIEMPVMNGFEATRAIRDFEKKTGAPGAPIIALTAHAFNEHQKKCLEAGCDAFITKPLKKATLVGMIGAIRENAAGGGVKKLNFNKFSTGYNQ
ncbi:MAG: response regulator, partial [Desulfobacterales bacterium]|nr:response regulator [Desulfobacterales bacterium]